MDVVGSDSLEVLCAPGDLVDSWGFTIKNVGKACWPENTCLRLEDSKQSMIIKVGAVPYGKLFRVSGIDNEI
jgi:hypothetical protein